MSPFVRYGFLRWVSLFSCLLYRIAYYNVRLHELSKALMFPRVFRQLHCPVDNSLTCRYIAYCCDVSSYSLSNVYFAHRSNGRSFPSFLKPCSHFTLDPAQQRNATLDNARRLTTRRNQTKHRNLSFHPFNC